MPMMIDEFLELVYIDKTSDSSVENAIQFIYFLIEMLNGSGSVVMRSSAPPLALPVVFRMRR